jgi:hypothetical protein
VEELMRIGLIGVTAALSVMAPAAWAHHGWSSYDQEKVLEVRAPLKDLSWGNPHGMAKVEWQGATWDVVLAPTSRMEARGLSQDMVSQGQPVTLVGYPKRDGTLEMRIERVIVGGKTVELR